MATYLDSLCWNCSKGADECEFMRKLVPVPNWKAKIVPYDGYYGKTYTYVVEKCPNFVPMRETNGKMPCGQRKKISVRCVETGIVYSSINKCSKATHISKVCITKCIDGDIDSAKGLHFERVVE